MASCGSHFIFNHRIIGLQASDHSTSAEKHFILPFIFGSAKQSWLPFHKSRLSSRLPVTIMLHPVSAFSKLSISSQMQPVLGNQNFCEPDLKTKVVMALIKKLRSVIVAFHTRPLILTSMYRNLPHWATYANINL